MSARILIADDKKALAELLRSSLEAEGYEVETVMRGDEAESRLKQELPDLAILNWLLPELSGVELCRRLRAQSASKTLPIILLADRCKESDMAYGLLAGADDCVVKPFPVPELLARVHALLRRTSPNCIATLLTAGEVQLDREKMRVMRAGRPVRIGPKEYRLLEFLMERVGRVFTRRELILEVWGNEAGIGEQTVDVYVGRLRAALIRRYDSDPIRTVRGIGYAFNDRIESPSPRRGQRRAR